MLPCMRTNYDKIKLNFAEKLSNQLFDLGFLFGAILEMQLITLNSIENKNN